MRIVFAVVFSSLLIATSGMGADGEFEAASSSGGSAVEQARLWVAGVDKPAHVLSPDTRPFWKPAEASPGPMVRHWNHGGCSNFMAGKCLADIDK
jgi:hypothetical protein